MSESEINSEDEPCSNCGGEIEDDPLFPSRDVQMGEDGLEYVEDPDGPFCDIGCRREFDGE